MAKRPIDHVQLTPSHFLSDADFIAWPAALRGAYCSLLFYMYANNGRIRNDPEYIRGLVNWQGERWEDAYRLLRKKCKVNHGFLTHKRVVAELAKAEAFLQHARASGHKGAKARWQPQWQPYGNPNGNPMANVMKGKVSKEDPPYTPPVDELAEETRIPFAGPTRPDSQDGQDYTPGQWSSITHVAQLHARWRGKRGDNFRARMPSSWYQAIAKTHDAQGHEFIERATEDVLEAVFLASKGKFHWNTVAHYLNTAEYTPPERLQAQAGRDPQPDSVKAVLAKLKAEDKSSQADHEAALAAFEALTEEERERLEEREPGQAKTDAQKQARRMAAALRYYRAQQKGKNDDELQ